MKTRSKIFTLVTLAMLIASSPAFPAVQGRYHGSNHKGRAGHGPNFVDRNGDGICDYRQSGVRPRAGQQGRKWPAPRLNHRGQAGHGPNFVDNNGDGICDYRQ